MCVAICVYLQSQIAGSCDNSQSFNFLVSVVPWQKKFLRRLLTGHLNYNGVTTYFFSAAFVRPLQLHWVLVPHPIRQLLQKQIQSRAELEHFRVVNWVFMKVLKTCDISVTMSGAGFRQLAVLLKGGSVKTLSCSCSCGMFCGWLLGLWKNSALFGINGTANWF